MRHLQIWSHWIFLMCDRREKYIENWAKINYLSNDWYAWHIDILSTFFSMEVLKIMDIFRFCLHISLVFITKYAYAKAQAHTCIHATGWYLALVNKYQHVLLLHAIYYQLLTWPSVERFCLKNQSESQAKIHLFKWVPLKPLKTISSAEVRAFHLCRKSNSILISISLNDNCIDSKYFYFGHCQFKAKKNIRL